MAPPPTAPLPLPLSPPFLHPPRPLPLPGPACPACPAATGPATATAAPSSSSNNYNGSGLPPLPPEAAARGNTIDRSLGRRVKHSLASAYAPHAQKRPLREQHRRLQGEQAMSVRDVAEEEEEGEGVGRPEQRQEASTAEGAFGTSYDDDDDDDHEDDDEAREGDGDGNNGRDCSGGGGGRAPLGDRRPVSMATAVSSHHHQRQKKETRDPRPRRRATARKVPPQSLHPPPPPPPPPPPSLPSAQHCVNPAAIPPPMIPQTAPLPSPASHRQQPHPQPQQPQQQQHQRTTRSLSLAFVASVLARRLTARKSRRRAQPATLGSEPQEQSSPIPTSPARGEHSDGRSPHIAWRSMPSLPVRSGTRAESSVLANVTRKWSVHRRRPATTLSVETFDPPSPPRDEVLRPATPTDANPSIVVGLPLSAPTVPTYPNLPSMGGVPIRTEENRSTETTQPGNLLTSAIASLGAPELMANLRPKGHGVWPTHAIQDGSESDTTNNVSASIRNEQSPLSPSEALTTNTAVMTAQHPADICDDTGRVSPSLSLPTSFRHSASSLLSLVMASVDDAHDYPEPLGDPCYRESAETAVDILPAAVGDSSQKVESNRQEWSGFEVGEFMGSQGHIPNVDSSFNKVKTIGGPENAEQIKNKVNVNLSSAGIKMPRDVPLTFAPTHAVTERSQYQSKIIRPHTALSKLDMANRTIFIVSEVTASTLPSATIGEELVPAEIEPENGEGTPGQWSRLSSAFKRKDFIPRNDAMPSRSFRRKGQDRLSISSEPSDSDGRLANWAQRLVRRMSSKKMLGSSRNLASSTFERTEEEDETPYTSDFNLRSPVDESSAGWKRAVGRFHAAFAFASRSHRRASSPLATVDRLPLPQSPPQAELPPRTLRRRSRQYKSLSSLATRDQIPPVVVAMDRKAAKSLQNDMGTPLASIIERKPKQPTSNSTSLSLFLQRTISRRRKHDFAPEPRASVLAGIELVNEGSVGGSRGGTPTTGPALVLVTDSYLAALESARRAVKGTDLKSEATDSEVLPSEHQTTGPSALDAVKLHSSERGGLISIPTEPGMPCHSQEPTVPETAQVFRRIKRVSSAARTSDASRTRSAHVRRRTTNPKAQADDRSTSTGRIAALPIQCHCFDCVQLESDPSDSACELVTISPTSTATKRLESDES